jgi:hypothetical protein
MTVRITNCIIWGNDADLSGKQLAVGYCVAAAVSYCDFDGGQGWVHVWLDGILDWGEGNIGIDPWFAEPGYWADDADPNIEVEPNEPNAVWIQGDYHLLRFSPCIDTGDNNSIAPDAADLDGDSNTAEPIPWDLDGRLRIVDGDKDHSADVDMGIFEFFNTAPVAVAGSDQTAYARGPGNAYVSLDGSASYDDDGDELNCRWSWPVDGRTMTATGITAVIELPVGIHTIELIVNDGIADSEPDTVVVTIVPAFECSVRLTPRSLNVNSKGKWVRAHFTLPRGVTGADVDANSPVTIEPLTIESSYIRLIGNRHGRKLRAGFERAAFCRVTSFGPAEVTVTGRLISGQYFYGTTAITLISHTLPDLAGFASYWLRSDCAGPDWCNDHDRDRDSTVNFEDFIMLDRCGVEIFAP